MDEQNNNTIWQYLTLQWNTKTRTSATGTIIYFFLFAINKKQQAPSTIFHDVIWNPPLPTVQILIKSISFYVDINNKQHALRGSLLGPAICRKLLHSVVVLKNL